MKEAITLKVQKREVTEILSGTARNAGVIGSVRETENEIQVVEKAQQNRECISSLCKGEGDIQGNEVHKKNR